MCYFNFKSISYRKQKSSQISVNKHNIGQYMLSELYLFPRGKSINQSIIKYRIMKNKLTLTSINLRTMLEKFAPVSVFNYSQQGCSLFLGVEHIKYVSVCHISRYPCFATF